MHILECWFINEINIRFNILVKMNNLRALVMLIRPLRMKRSLQKLQNSATTKYATYGNDE